MSGISFYFSSGFYNHIFSESYKPKDKHSITANTFRDNKALHTLKENLIQGTILFENNQLAGVIRDIENSKKISKVHLGVYAGEEIYAPFVLYPLNGVCQAHVFSKKNELADNEGVYTVKVVNFEEYKQKSKEKNIEIAKLLLSYEQEKKDYEDLEHMKWLREGTIFLDKYKGPINFLKDYPHIFKN